MRTNLVNSFARSASLALTASLLLSACEQGAQQQQQAMPPAQVEVLAVTPIDAPFVISLPATVSGSKEVEIRARVSGVLESRNFSEGQKVSAGQSLFTIDLAPYQLAYEQAQAALAAAEARLEQAQKESKRLAKLREDNSVSQRDYDNARSSVDIAKADLNASEVLLREAKLNLDYAQVKAPVNGIMGREQVSEGTYVSGPEVLLTQITALDPVRVRFGLSEREQLMMRQAQKRGELTLPADGQWQTQLKLQDGSLYEHMGTVNFTDVRINANTGTSEFQAIVANPDFSLRPGQFVQVELLGAEHKGTFAVPQKAVLDNGTGKFVYLAATNEQGATIARPAPVEVGEWYRQQKGEQIENLWIIRSGLSAGDKVIVEGMARIFFPGMPVSIINEQG
ncbi:efflux RND transporter periplasmic adaptor subunit [Pseudoalteromonas sp. BDTF-M6]|uniref:efflux RND transporter periplasmic adaptor subunit n=1 Tax=Pseudoalteromonas sp. BDTF-M6 TaxID=2796132 RepID=UPI001BAF6B1C|nr:efflux RND transporter periplasmic adaptor subunit [Pseudoalteromonas sp. BDTF-M6]MBS3796892.1 efflux RND transporter periplasmic adaptor subunit [Pseudoalteromonas sp. BDTF-M6]